MTTNGNITNINDFLTHGKNEHTKISTIVHYRTKIVVTVYTMSASVSPIVHFSRFPVLNRNSSMYSRTQFRSRRSRTTKLGPNTGYSVRWFHLCDKRSGTCS